MNLNQSNQSSLEQQLLLYVSRENYRPVKPKVIIKKLGIQEEQQREFKRILKELLRLKIFKWGPSHLVTLADAQAANKRLGPLAAVSRRQAKERMGKKSKTVAAQSDLANENTDDYRERTETKSKAGRGRKQMIGKYRRSNSGHGYVLPTTVSESIAELSDRIVDEAPDEKIFIRAENSQDASSGDIVRISYSRVRRGDSTELAGAIEQIIKRRSNRFVGSYQLMGGVSYVTVEGGQFQQPILVGDASAKNVIAEDKVVIEMVRFPNIYDAGEAVVVEVLGKFGKPNLDTLMVMRQYDLPEEFPEEVLENARQQADNFQEEITGNRQDFTNRTIITIDPKDARDFDDAISLERIENGHWVLGVHIADVSHFVPPKSQLDDEAYRRGTSVYLPDRVVPMLPEIISNNLASLQPDRLRFAMTALIEFTPDGKLVGTEFCRSAIKSVRRFTYEEVDEYLADPTLWQDKLTPDVFRLLGEMLELAMILRTNRFENGSLEMMLPELKLQLDREGKVIGAKAMENTQSHQMIEEFMLIANVAVATQLTDKGLNVLRRVHDSPNERRLGQLTEFVRELGIETEGLQNRFEIKRVLEETADSQFRQAVHFGVLRSMQKAVYSPKEGGHFALNFDNYCHFTSPIRRYPDLIIHRMLGQIIDQQRPKDDLKWLTLAGEHCSEREQNAEQAERDLIKLKLLLYFNDKIGHEMEGVITGAESFGLFVQGLEIPAEGLVPTANLPDDQYFYDDRARCLMGRQSLNQFRLGDKVLVKIIKVDLVKRELDLQLLKSLNPTQPSADSIERMNNSVARSFGSRSSGGKGRDSVKRGQKTDKNSKKPKRRH